MCTGHGASGGVLGSRHRGLKKETNCTGWHRGMRYEPLGLSVSAVMHAVEARMHERVACMYLAVLGRGGMYMAGTCRARDLLS